MKDVLADIQSGSFAERWVSEVDSGGEQFRRFRERDRDHQIEQVGAELRSKMPVLDPVTVQAGHAQAAHAGAAGAARAPGASGSTGTTP
jgi:ketol-acid reductoisomerase